jgi:hypothetical protein
VRRHNNSLRIAKGASGVRRCSPSMPAVRLARRDATPDRSTLS